MDGTNGFSTRFMWRTNGRGEIYVCMPSSPIRERASGAEASLREGALAMSRAGANLEYARPARRRGAGVSTAGATRGSTCSFARCRRSNRRHLLLDVLRRRRSELGPRTTPTPTSPRSRPAKRVGCAETRRSPAGVSSRPPLETNSGKEAGGPYLPDFSYAGYRWGESRSRSVATLDVTSFGAIADGDRTTEAFKKALSAAQRQKGASFAGAEGRFIVTDILL
jgi:hypothetical protein